MLDRSAIDGMVTLVDAVNGADAIERFEEAGRKVAVADLNIQGATTAICFSATGPIAPAAPDSAISALQASLGTDPLRIEGLIKITDPPDTPCVLRIVGHVSSPLRRFDGWPEEMDAPCIAMIVAGPGGHAAQEMFVRFLPELTPLNPNTQGQQLEITKH